MTSKQVGTVIWYDNRDGYGQIKTSLGQRVYFDASTLKFWANMPVRSGDTAEFEINEAIKSPICAKNVRIKMERI